MNELEINILNYIKNHGSFERPVPLKLLKAEFDISERGIKEIIERLRCNFKQPVIASRRTKRGGYYLPKKRYGTQCRSNAIQRANFDLSENSNGNYISKPC